MTLEELTRETLTAKHQRLQREKCKHRDTYSSGCTSELGSFAVVCCLRCGKTWNYSGEK